MKSVPPKGTRRQKQKDETRGIILEAARHLFSENGFKKTTIRQIARQAEVGFGTVFNHFPDKASLLIAALLEDLDLTQVKAMVTFPENESVCGKFLHLSRHFYQYYAQNIPLSQTLIKEMWFVKGEWGQNLKAHANRYLALIEEIIESGKRTGEIRKDVDNGIAAASFFSHYYSVLLMGLDSDVLNPDDLVRILEMMIDQTLKGIALPKK